MSLNRAKAVLCLALVLLVPLLCRAEGDVDQARLNAANSEPQDLGPRREPKLFFSACGMNDGNVGRLVFARVGALHAASGQRQSEAVPAQDGDQFGHHIAFRHDGGSSRIQSHYSGHGKIERGRD